MSDILVDSNILVYSFDPRDRAKQERSQQLLAQWASAGIVVLSVQCLTEFFRTVRWRLPEPLGPEQALAEVIRFTAVSKVLDLTAAIVLEACRTSNRYQTSIWDALIWASARLNEIPFVLTEDVEHESFLEGVRYLNPFHPAFDPQVIESSI